MLENRYSCSGLPLWLSWLRMHLQCRRPGFDPCVGRSPGEGNGNPFRYSRLENPMDRGAWWATVYGVERIQTRLSNFHFHFSSDSDVQPNSGATTPLHPPCSCCSDPPKAQPDLPELPNRRGKCRSWASLVVQWFRIDLPMQGTTEDEMAGWHH